MPRYSVTITSTVEEAWERLIDLPGVEYSCLGSPDGLTYYFEGERRTACIGDMLVYDEDVSCDCFHEATPTNP